MIRSFDGVEPQLGDDCFVADSALVLGKVTLGVGASVWYGCVLRGDVHSIDIGAQTNVQDRSVVHVTSGRWSTVVGAEVTVGHAAVLHGCRIGDRVLVGMGAIVLDGVEVGDECVVAAGSLLPPGKRYPPRSLIMGSPGRVVRPVDAEQGVRAVASARDYVALARRHRLLLDATTHETL